MGCSNLRVLLQHSKDRYAMLNFVDDIRVEVHNLSKS